MADGGWKKYEGRSKKEDVRRKMYENVVAQMCSTSSVRD
jgi:hypothetical protein